MKSPREKPARPGRPDKAIPAASQGKEIKKPSDAPRGTPRKNQSYPTKAVARNQQHPASRKDPDLKEKLSSLPEQPGVYLMKDARDHIIYIGKAKNLKNRVRSYFQAGKTTDFKTQAMSRNIADLECIVTPSELEAFVLENSLIKKHKPRYNIVLRDDKNYPYLRLTITEDFPRIEVVRKVARDGNLYFGPYVPATPMRQTLDFINRHFLLRRCTTSFTEESVREHPARPCLNYQMGLSPAPCAGLVSKEDYRRTMDEVRLFLQGKKGELLAELREQMDKAAREMRFEEAARLRDRLRAVEKVLESQRIVSADLVDQDVVGFKREGSVMAVQTMFLRNGMITGRKDFLLESLEEPDDVVLLEFLRQFYGNEVSLPEELVIPLEIPGIEVLGQWLSELRGKKVDITVPKRGRKSDMVAMADENARLSLLAHRATVKGGEKRAAELQRELRLTKAPLHMECFDISNLQGKESVASLVVFRHGSPVKAEYRNFGIKTVEGANDFASMEEVVYRRYRRLLDEGGTMPDLVVIDGGRGQLGAALKALDRVGVVGQNIIGLAKARTKGKGEKTDFERAYLPGEDSPTVLDPASAACHLVQRIRDEAHRFAVAHHRKVRDRKAQESVLAEIEGVGEQRKRDLLKHFGSVRRIAEASVEDIARLRGISRRLAEEIKKKL